MTRIIECWILCVVLLALSPGALLAQERWVYRYDGLENGDDWANSVVMGSDGNVYAAGLSRGIGTQEDLTVVSLTPSGNERWVYMYDGPASGSDGANSVTAGSDGNIYAAGYSRGNGSFGDFTVVSLTASGVERWVYRYNGPGNSEDWAYSIVMGLDGNLYAAGWSRGSTTWDDFVVISLTPLGSPRWVHRYDGPASEFDRAYSIVAGSDGNLYVAGASTEIWTAYDLTVLSLTPYGERRWVYRSDGPGNGSDCLYSIVVGTDGNLYAVGSSWESASWDDCAVVSLTVAGQERWLYLYDGPGNEGDIAYSAVMGSDGNLYIAGESVGNGTMSDLAVLSLTTSGGERWVYRYSPANWTDEASSIAEGSDGNLYVAGRSIVDSSPADFTVVNLTPSGEERWIYRYNGPGDGWDWARSIVVGSDGNAYAAGWSEGTDTGEDLTVVSLSLDVGVSEHGGKTAAPLVLQMAVSPIPASSSVRIHYSLSEAAEVKLSIYDVSGRLVQNLVSAREESGSRAVTWDGKDSQGRRITSGTYFVRLEASGLCISRKFIIM